MGAPGSTPSSARIYLHIGAMKTGTTFLQHLMEANRTSLLGAGYLFPGEEWQDQVRAVRDILGSLRGRPAAPDIEGCWAAMRDEMLAFDGAASILSMEFLSFCTPERAAAVVATLAGADVHVVLTVRDFAGALPAQWQTRCRVNGTVPWPRFARGVGKAIESGTGGGPAGKVFRRAQDVPRMLDVWVPLLGPERVHVVTVPPRGSDPMLLWRRFAEVVGVDPAACTPVEVPSNPSLGHPSGELLRRIHAELDGSVEKHALAAVIQDVVARDLEKRAHLEPRVRLDRQGFALVARWNRRVREAIEASGVPVTGSLDDLPTEVPADADLSKVEQPTDEQLLAAAATARDSLLGLAARRGLPAPESPAAAERWSAESDPVAAAVTDLAELVRRCASAAG